MLPQDEMDVATDSNTKTLSFDRRIDMGEDVRTRQCGAGMHGVRWDD